MAPVRVRFPWCACAVERIDAGGLGRGVVRARLVYGLRARAEVCSAAAIGSYWVVPPPLPRSTETSWGRRCGASYSGGVDPGLTPHVGLGVEGVPSSLPTMLGALVGGV